MAEPAQRFQLLFLASGLGPRAGRGGSLPGLLLWRCSARLGLPSEPARLHGGSGAGLRAALELLLRPLPPATDSSFRTLPRSPGVLGGDRGSRRVDDAGRDRQAPRDVDSTARCQRSDGSTLARLVALLAVVAFLEGCSRTARFASRPSPASLVPARSLRGGSGRSLDRPLAVPLAAQHGARSMRGRGDPQRMRLGAPRRRP